MKTIHIIKTVSFEGDGRLHKWIKSLNNYNLTSEVNIVEDSNQEEFFIRFDSKISKSGFFFRKFFPRHKGQIFKIPEYGMKILFYLIKNKSDVVVFHDVQQYLNILIGIMMNVFGKRRILIWDLHELPHTYLSKYFITREYIKFILSKVDVLVYTNNERRQYMLDKFNHKEKQFLILNNFPDNDFMKFGKQPLPEELSKWLSVKKNKNYILWMGAALKGRNFGTVLKAFEQNKDKINLVIMGNIDSEFAQKIEKLKNENVIFNKYVNQDQIINYVDNAYFSIVLYKSDKPNNIYCEPNRLYQLISRNIPSVTGNNPTMKNIIEKYGGGLVLEDDGQNLNIMKSAFEYMLKIENLSVYQANLESIDKQQEFNWEVQFLNLISKIKNLV